MPKLSETVFATTPDTELIVEDVYKKKDNEVVNAPQFQSRANEAQKEISDAEWQKAVEEANANAKQIVPAPPLEQLSSETLESSPVATVDLGNMSETIKDQGFKVSNAIGGLPDSIKSAVNTAQGVMNSAKGMVSPAASTVNQVVNGVRSEIDGAALSALKGVGSAINNMTNGAVQMSFDDRMSVSKLGANLVAQADSMGVQGAYGMFTQGQTDPYILNNMTRELVPVAVNTGSLGLLSDMSMGPASAHIKTTMPNVVSEFSKNYVAPVTSTINATVAQGKQMIDTFDRIDSNWATGVNGAIRVDALVNGSPSTKKVMGALAANANLNIGGLDVSASIGTVPARSRYSQIGAAVIGSVSMSSQMGSISVGGNSNAGVTNARVNAPIRVPMANTTIATNAGFGNNPYGTPRTSQSNSNARVALNQDFPMTVPIVPPQEAQRIQATGPQPNWMSDDDSWLIE